MQWASAVSTQPDTAAAIAEVAAAVHAELGTLAPDLLTLFVSAQHRHRFSDVPELVRRAFPSGLLIGCSAGGVIGGGKEVEHKPGVSLTAAALPDVDLMPFHIAPGTGISSALPGLRPASSGSPRAAGSDGPPHFLVLADPFSFNPEQFLKEFDTVYPTSRKIGGLASGGQQPGENVLFLDRDVHRTGLVGVAFSGNVEVDTIVAQGCRPIGQPMFVTKCQGNILWEIDGRPAVEVLQEVYSRLDPADQELAQHSLFLGIVMNEHQHEYAQGDFLIRNVMGMDAERGVLVIGAVLHPSSVVQFHLRDATTSAQDLEHLLAAYAAAGDRRRAEPGPAAVRPAGALLFSCLGRGVHLYGEPDHDTNVFRAHLGAVPLGGFFCNGEIGPVRDTTFLHGYTSAFGLFKPRRG